MANAFIPDEKRRHQYVPVNEEPPDYDVASNRTSEAGPSDAAHSSRRSRTQRRSRRTERTEAQDDVDALPSDNEEDEEGHDAPEHRADSEDSSMRDFQELELETDVPKEPVLIRITKRIHRMTLRVDQVLYRYVNATIMRYVYGAVLGVFVISLVYLFGGSLPKLTLPKRYREDALRTYINEETSAINIKQFTQQLTDIYNKKSPVDATYDTSKLASWIHDEFVKLGVARNAIDSYFVYLPTSSKHGQSLTVRNAAGESFSATMTDEHGELRTTITHGTSANVTAPLLYANYASQDDLRYMEDHGIHVPGSIVLFKRDSKIALAQQILNLQNSGAVGCIVFASTQDYVPTGAATYPDGPYLADSMALGGDAALTWLQPGDVLTPGFPSLERNKVIPLEEAAALLRIPTVSISAADAGQVLSLLSGHGVQVKELAWQVTSTDESVYTGSIDSNAVQVDLVNLLETQEKHEIYDVLSEILGDESDQVLVVGAPMSSLSTVATLLEVSRIYADLVTKYAWKPRRSVVFALWDGTNQNYLGSTEWAEDQIKSLRHQGIAYLNLANAVSLSGEVLVRATPSLSGALLQAMQHVENAYQNATVADDLGLSMLSETAEPLDFSDSIAFEAHVGIAVADIGFPMSNVAPSCLSSVKCIESFVDPEFRNHLVLAKVFAMVILEIVDEKFLPLNVHAYARSIESDIQQLAKKYPELNFGGDLSRVLQTLDQNTDLTMQWRNEWEEAFRDNKEIETTIWALKRSNWNYAVTKFHRNLLRSSAWTNWFGHPIYGPSTNLDGSLRSWMFPHIESVLATGDTSKAQAMIEVLGQTILDAAEALRH